MDITQTSLSGVPTLVVTGDIDHSTADLFASAVEHSLRGNDALLLDLAGCPYLDSGGLAVVLSTVQGLPPNGWLGVMGCNPNVGRLFQIIGLETQPGFRRFSSRQQALSALAQG